MPLTATCGAAAWMGSAPVWHNSLCVQRCHLPSCVALQVGSRPQVRIVVYWSLCLFQKLVPKYLQIARYQCLMEISVGHPEIHVYSHTVLLQSLHVTFADVGALAVYHDTKCVILLAGTLGSRRRPAPPRATAARAATPQPYSAVMSPRQRRAPARPSRLCPLRKSAPRWRSCSMPGAARQGATSSLVSQRDTHAVRLFMCPVRARASRGMFLKWAKDPRS